MSFGANPPKPNAAANRVAPVDFQKDVRPILADACFACHGPDKATRLMNLRLDTRDGAFQKRKSGSPIVPGNPQASLVYQRITQEKAALRMPPAMSHKTLTDAQKEIIRRWIQQGAPWKEPWAFSAPKRPALPPVRHASWPRNPIDRFILARLEAAGLKPAPEADRRTLARRVSLDLTGLPPEPAAVDAFLNDKSPKAYEKYVDQMLASPRWGEHRARYWLDAARYGDTHGIHVDNYREMWPYRDWVIAAFNHNMSFDEFTKEQIAGDLMPSPTMDQLIATGFHRCNVTTNEAGVILEEIDAIYAKDRADTTAAVWMGLTLGCATCHDHKFDPLSQKDFYAMTAFFRNTQQHTMDDNIPDTPPVLVVPRDEDRPRWERLRQEESETRARMLTVRASSEPQFERWLAGGEYREISAPVPRRPEILRLDMRDGPAVVTEDGRRTLDTGAGVAVGDASTAERKALHFAKKASAELGPLERIEPDKPFSVTAWFYFPRNEDSFVVASQSDNLDKNRGWVLQIGARVPSFRMAGDDGRGISIAAGHLEQLQPGTWNHLAVTYDGSREQAGLSLYVNGHTVTTQGAGDQNTNLRGCFNTRVPVRLAKEGERGLGDGAIADFRIFDRVITEEEAHMVSQWPRLDTARHKPVAILTQEERDALQLYFVSNRDEEYIRLASRLPEFKAERREIRQRGAVTHIMQERTDTRPYAYVLFRGMYDQKRQKVEPDTPAALPSMRADMPHNRLGLAEWLIDPANPLTARVTVNRFWQETFGTGLVKTSEDFGSQGQPPANPELLDWLAVDFRESGWDVKRFFRQMVLSAAYRQSAQTTPEKLQKDPDNRLLSRGPRFRMDGEMIRDMALESSGLLSPKIGGPSVKPYQPEGIWEAVAMIGSNTRFYKQDSGDKLYRRSLYTFWKRSAPPASMEIFNAPTRETCTVRRERTDTPLQALVTLNDPQFVEAARYLAEKAYQSSPDFDAQIDFVTMRVLSRPMQDREREIVRRGYGEFSSYYKEEPQKAEKLLATGASPYDHNIDPAAFAALTMVTSQIMNLDEALNK
ncbi:MAG: DUF1553 domain-containing protein [Bryobacterales bacterium]|nr:DUF1553 domain-containing protein [Bryobacterales bacterium]